MALSKAAQDLYDAFMRRAKARPDHWFWGNRSSDAYDALVRVWNEDAVVELALMGVFDGIQLIELCRYGGHLGSVSKRDNPRLVPLFQRLREHKSELPADMQSYLDWLENVHGY